VRPADFFANCPLFWRKNAVFAPLEGFSFAMLLLFDLHFGFALR